MGKYPVSFNPPSSYSNFIFQITAFYLFKPKRTTRSPISNWENFCQRSSIILFVCVSIFYSTFHLLFLLRTLHISIDWDSLNERCGVAREDDKEINFRERWSAGNSNKNKRTRLIQPAVLKLWDQQPLVDIFGNFWKYLWKAFQTFSPQLATSKCQSWNF